MKVPFKLQDLPDELLDIILSYLPTSAQSAISRVSRRLYHAAVIQLYRSIELTDFCNHETNDEHDDTPMIRMLFLFVQNPFLASQVRELSHRCHLHLPDVWMDLPNMTFSNPTFSVDSRTSRLLHRAILNLTHVDTLRIIFGHQTIVQALLSGFLNGRPSWHQPIRRLWVESSCLADLSWIRKLPIANNLETFRCRRLSLYNETYSNNVLSTHEFRLARSRQVDSNGSRIGIENGTYTTTTRLDTDEHEILSEAKLDAIGLEDRIYQRLPSSTQAYCNGTNLSEVSMTELSIDESSIFQPPTTKRGPGDIDQPPNDYIQLLLQASSSTLTSLNLDWLLGGQTLVMGLAADYPCFPKLRALQVRNAVEDYARMPYHDKCCLLAKPWLDFIKRHPNIQCLAWPLDCFVPTRGPETHEETDHEAINQLGRTLKELRLDTWIDTSGRTELGTDQTSGRLLKGRLQRRAFIDTIAPKLTALEVFKLEGSVTYNDRNELITALHKCPLRKVVIIGTCWAVHDSWKDIPADCKWLLRHNQWDIRDTITWQASTTVSLQDPNVPWTQNMLTTPASGEVSPSENFQGRAFSNTVLETLALTHASTITELKFCGFNGAPPFPYPGPETCRQLSFLRCFHNLTYLTTAVWLSTYFRDSNCTSEVRASWYARHRGTPTALTLVNPIAPKDRPPYAQIMAPQIEPRVLADRIAKLVGPYLSSQAIERKAGVTVKALFLLHRVDGSADLYEMEVKIGRTRKAISFVGPRGEHDPQREKEKMMNRGWF